MLLPTGSQMQRIDRAAIDGMGIPSLDLMERAGEGVARAISEVYEDGAGGPVVIVCGKGNNAGDGLVAARLAAAQGRDVHLWLVWSEDDFSEDPRANWQRLEEASDGAAGTVTVSSMEGKAVDPARLAEAWKDAAVVVDALLGTGIGGAPRAPLDGWITAMNLCGRPVLAVDVPSGVDADTGEVAGAAPLAWQTVTMAYPKLGLLLHPGRQHAGSIRVVDIGIPPSAADGQEIQLSVMTHAQAALLLPLRPPASHKGDYGRLAILAGSAGMMGAARLACAAACRTGAGLVRHVAPSSLLAIAQGGRPEVMVAPLEDGGTGRLVPGHRDVLEDAMEWADVTAAGPGIGRHAETAAFLHEAFSCAEEGMPLVLDADGLEHLAADPSLREVWAGPVVITPHPGEAARLLGKQNSEVVADRVGSARALAERYDAVALLKGAPTLVTAPDGTTLLCPLGNPGMASGGTGDVLTGVIAALLGQGLAPFEAASLGAYIHALAGDLAALDLGVWSLVAGDIVDYLPIAFGHLEAFPDRDLLADGVWG